MRDEDRHGMTCKCWNRMRVAYIDKTSYEDEWVYHFECLHCRNTERMHVRPPRK